MYIRGEGYWTLNKFLVNTEKKMNTNECDFLVFSEFEYYSIF